VIYLVNRLITRSYSDIEEIQDDGKVDLGSSGATRAGSNPVIPTIHQTPKK